MLEKNCSIVNAICQEDTVELRLVGERMLRFNNRRKFKTFKGEKGERVRSWDGQADAGAELHTAESLLRLSSSTRTQWDSSLQRTYGGRLADAFEFKLRRGRDFLESYTKAKLVQRRRVETFPCCTFPTLEGGESSFATEVKWKPLDNKRHLFWINMYDSFYHDTELHCFRRLVIVCDSETNM